MRPLKGSYQRKVLHVRQGQNASSQFLGGQHLSSKGRIKNEVSKAFWRELERATGGKDKEADIMVWIPAAGGKGHKEWEELV